MKIQISSKELERILFDHFCSLKDPENPIAHKSSTHFELNFFDRFLNLDLKVSLHKGEVEVNGKVEDMINDSDHQKETEILEVDGLDPTITSRSSSGDRTSRVRVKPVGDPKSTYKPADS